MLYIGDDLIDLPLLKEAGYSCCPSDAVKEVLSSVDYVSPYKGGEGVLRDIADKLLGN